MSQPARIEPAYRNRDAVYDLVRSGHSYPALARYANSEAERKAVGSTTTRQFVPPWFRCDFATHGNTHVDGADDLLRESGVH